MNNLITIDVKIPVGDSFIQGTLHCFKDSISIVVFAHGSGSSRLSSRNKFVAELLHKQHFSTFLFDLLTPEEERVDLITREFRFDIELLAERLLLVTQWIQTNQETAHLKIGYFGASTGAAAALIAAAHLTTQIFAVVSRGGRPDLALPYLKRVTSPTLLIVGALDHEVIELNKIAYDNLIGDKNIVLIANASHLFEEGNTLEEAAQAAVDWFKLYE